MKSPIHVVLISAQPLWLQVCRPVLESLPRKIKVLPVVTDGILSSELVRAISNHPDLAVLSLDLPVGGLDMVRTLRIAGYEGAVLVLCSHYALPTIEELTDSGIQGIISSLSSLEDLQISICALVDNSPEPLIQQYLRIIRALDDHGCQVVLNERERQILQSVAYDLTDLEIAERLNISVRTVNNHLHHIYAKLRVKGRAGAVATAIVQGIICPRTLPALTGTSK